MPRLRKKISTMNLLHLRGPVMVGDVVYPAGGRFGARIQRDFQLVAIHEGELDLVLDGVEIHVARGEGILLSPGHEERFTFARRRETRHSWCTIRLEAVPHALRRMLRGMSQPRLSPGA